MFTLIHEAGHSMHSFYTRKSQPFCYGNYTLFVAEVASICNEMLLTDYLLKNTEDRALKMYILNHAMDGFRGTLFRQTLFAEFEKEAHARAEAGEALTPELLCSIYKGLNAKYYGAVVERAFPTSTARSTSTSTPPASRLLSLSRGRSSPRASPLWSATCASSRAVRRKIAWICSKEREWIFLLRRPFSRPSMSSKATSPSSRSSPPSRRKQLVWH
jgi:hypothetical protein